MPNYCECDLTISGKVNEVKRFLSFVRTDGENGEREFDFDTLIPTPEGYYDDGRWYDWHIENWDTKWNACDVCIGEPYEYDGKADVEVNFSTAWSPPEKVIIKAGELFPELEFNLRYFEMGFQFNGQLVMKGGEIASQETGKYFGDRGG